MSGDTVVLGTVGILAPLFTAWAASRSIRKQHELTMAEMRGQFGATLDSHGRELVEVKTEVRKLSEKISDHGSRIASIETACNINHNPPPFHGRFGD